jgi:hypothetical protein
MQRKDKNHTHIIQFIRNIQRDYLNSRKKGGNKTYY